MGGRGAVQHTGLVAGTGEGVNVEDGREVDERSGYRGDRDRVGLGDISWVERSTALGKDALDAPFGGGDHLGRWCATLGEAVKVGRGPPAQD